MWIELGEPGTGVAKPATTAKVLPGAAKRDRARQKRAARGEHRDHQHLPHRTGKQSTVSPAGKTPTSITASRPTRDARWGEEEENRKEETARTSLMKEHGIGETELMPLANALHLGPRSFRRNQRAAAQPAGRKKGQRMPRFRIVKPQEFEELF